MNAQLTDMVRAELQRPVPPEAHHLANRIAKEHGTSVLAVLFYGSCLRGQTAEGVLDFYVLVDSYRGYHRGVTGAIANAALAPTVHYRHGEEARAKIAIISARSFVGRMRPDSRDTTLWARFCQPSALLYVRDKEAEQIAVDAIADAVATGAVWARRHGPENGTPAELWTALFRNTYGAELRVEDGGDRGKTIYHQAESYFDKMLLPALEHAHANQQTDKGWETGKSAREETRNRRAWRRRSIYGKLLNGIRLVKAAFTFDQKVEYIEWKIERHTGRPLELSAFQRRHPLIAAPAVLWRLLREGAVR